MRGRRGRGRVRWVEDFERIGGGDKGRRHRSDAAADKGRGWGCDAVHVGPGCLRRQGRILGLLRFPFGPDISAGSSQSLTFSLFLINPLIGLAATKARYSDS